MGMDVGHDRGPRSEINVTPFVDVVLVLLIIFMVLTPLMLQELSVNIPRKADEEVTADVAAQQLVLHLKADGRIALGDRHVRLESLAAQVRRTFARRQRKLLFVRVDDPVNYGRVVEAMDLCRGAGVKTLGMTTRR